MTHPVDDRTRRLVHVKYAAAAVEETLSSLREAVGRARSAGASWTQIATAMDLSRRAVLDRFGPGDLPADPESTGPPGDDPDALR